MIQTIARGGEYIRLGTPEQLKVFGLKDLTADFEKTGATVIVGDAGHYSRDPPYIAQRPKLTDGLRQAASWYEQGKLKPMITDTVSFDAASLQKAFEDFRKGTNNVGKIVVRCF